MQVKGLSTETGRLAAQQAQQHIDTSPLESPNGRRSMRNSLSGGGQGIGSAMGGNPLSSIGASGVGGGSGVGVGIPSGAIIGGNMAAVMAENAERMRNSGGNGSGGVGSSGCMGGNIISGPGNAAHCNAAAAISAAAASAAAAGGSGGGGGGGSGSGGSSVGLGSGAGVAHNLSSSSSNLKQECDSLMQSSAAAALAAGIPPYVPPPIYRHMSLEPPIRKRALRSPYGEQEVRGSVLRDGSKNSSSECASPISKLPYHRPSSSASSNAPTEADTMQSERTSPR